MPSVASRDSLRVAFMKRAAEVSLSSLEAEVSSYGADEDLQQLNAMIHEALFFGVVSQRRSREYSMDIPFKNRI